MNTNSYIKKFEKFHKKEAGRLSLVPKYNYNLCSTHFHSCRWAIHVKKKKKTKTSDWETSHEHKNESGSKTGCVMGTLADSVLKALFIPPSIWDLTCCYNPKYAVKGSNGRNSEENA